MNLMRLEFRKVPMKAYIMASLIIWISMLGFIYLFAYAPRIDPDPDMQVFAGYDNLVVLFGAFNMAVFCTMASVMYTKFIINEYGGKRAVLLFSYPVSRSKVLLAKIYSVSLFAITSMLATYLSILVIFSMTERFFPIVNDEFTLAILVKVIKLAGIFPITAAAISIISVGIGFIKKSVPATILSAILLSSLLCNIMMNTLRSESSALVFAGMSCLSGIAVIFLLLKNINTMEVN